MIKREQSTRKKISEEEISDWAKRFAENQAMPVQSLFS